ncbi:MAG: undecaprenyl-diphosphate phosphatase [Alphaproteobacteria bacterium]
MALFHIVVLAVVQGITEFLPISSSAHLILVPKLTGWPDQGLFIDVAVHVGTLGAVIAYLWRDVWLMLAGVGRLAMGQITAGARLLALLALATIPVVAAGYAMQEVWGGNLRDTEIIAWATIAFAVLLFIADKLSLTVRRIEHLTVASAVLIGASQILALIPGTSRSGITMTAARALGFERSEAARFSMLLSIPVIVAAGALSSFKIYQAGDVQLGRDALLSAGLSFVIAFIAISAMMAWLRRASFTPFVIYRLALGALLLAWIYGALADFAFIPPA